MNRFHSFALTVLSMLRLNVVRTRWLFVSFSLVMLISLSLQLEYVKAGGSTSSSDVIHLTIVGSLVLLFGWLGFSVHGRAVLEQAEQTQAPLGVLQRIAKVLFASCAMAIAILMLLLVIFVGTGNQELITGERASIAFYVLSVLCFPIALKWMK